MENIKYVKIQKEFDAFLIDNNVEGCLSVLRNSFSLDRTTQDELNEQQRKWNQIKAEQRRGYADTSDFKKELSKIFYSLQEIFNSLKPDDISSADEVPNKILIVTYRQGERKAEIEKLFPKDKYPHREIMGFSDDIPDGYKTAEIVVFDDLDNKTIDNDQKIRTLAHSIPNAYLLYFGKTNPLKNEKHPVIGDEALAARCADANSKFTIHARLKELLEFRKIYGLPDVKQDQTE